MPIIGESSTIRLDSIIFATDFSPASKNAGLYASAISVHFGTSLVIAHAFTLVQAALEVEAEKPLKSQQRIKLNHELTLTAEILDAGQGTTGFVLLEGDPCKMIPVFARIKDPALIVMGTHGGGSIDRLVLGRLPKEFCVIPVGRHSPLART
jgi:nucleotide-binding universal stress UspA family protein